MASHTGQAIYYHGPKTVSTGPAETPNPSSSEVQIQVAYNGICGTDLHIFHGDMDARVDHPAIIGHEMSGTIVIVGDDVDNWKVGDHVTVMPLDACGDCPACNAGHGHICHNLNFVGIDTSGAMQQRWNVAAELLIALPPDLPLDVAALTEPLAVAFHDVRRGEVAAGDHVAVIGGGPIGVLIGLVAQATGANVLLSEPDEGRRSIAAELGLDVVNPVDRDLAEYVSERSNGAGADVAFEVSGSPAGVSAVTSVLKTRGVAVIVAIHSQPPPLDLFQVFWRELSIRGARVYERIDFEAAVAALAEGSIPARRLITHVLPATDAQVAFETLEQGGSVLKVLVDCQGFADDES